MNREIKFRIWDGKQEYMITQPHLSIEHGVAKTNYRLEVLMQFTGLTDKNGKDIYEGDIISRPNTPKNSLVFGTVIFNEGKFKIDWHLKGLWNDVLFNHLEDVFIIGNIYETLLPIKKKVN